MKVPAIILAAITTAVVVTSSCTKNVEVVDPSSNPTDTVNGGNQNPYYCAGCGMG